MGVCNSETKRKPVTLNDTENAILQCKSCRDKIKQYIKRLEKRQNSCQEKAKELIRSKERDRARIYLRQKKLHQEQIKISEGQLEMIENQIKEIENASNLQDCMSVLKKGNEVLKNLQNTIKIEEWEKVKDDMDELKEKDQEISNFFKEKGINEDEYDEQVNNELDKLIKDIQGDAKIDLPNVPKNQIEEDEKVENHVKKKEVLA